jgi:hypothetical protein
MPPPDGQGHRFFVAGFPSSRGGSVFRTGFRNWLKREFLVSLKGLTEAEKTEISLRLCYETVRPGAEWPELAEGIAWFSGCGEGDRIESLHLSAPVLEDWEDEAAREKERPKVFSLFWDYREVWASFMGQYGIDLYREEMHWFGFNAMLAGLGPDTALGRRIASRRYDPQADRNDRAKVLGTKILAVPDGG